MDHLLIEMVGVQLVAFDLSLGDELADVKTHSSSQLGIEHRVFGAVPSGTQTAASSRRTFTTALQLFRNGLP
jgi:hypothetical protein